MRIEPSLRVKSIGGYAFAEVDKMVSELKKSGADIIDFGVGDPTVPTPAFIRNACRKAIEKRKSSGYPSYIGALDFRKAVAEWMAKRFGVALDPATEITSTIGSKEAVFNFAEGFVNPGDYVLIPSPGYPPYYRGTLFAEGKAYFMPIVAANGFLPDLDAIPSAVLKKAKILWLNYPNSPSGVVAPTAFLKKAAAFARRNNIILAADEAYTEIYFTKEAPHSILEVAKEGVVSFHSLSKRSAMTGWRVGWVAGDPKIVEVFRKVKTNIDSGTPTFIQDAAAVGLSDERHVAQMRQEYRVKRDILIEALVGAGLPDCSPQATLYIWQKGPKGMSSAEFARRLLVPDIAVVTTPGEWISDKASDGSNPGEGYVRFALVPSIADTKKAAKRLKNMNF